MTPPKKKRTVLWDVPTMKHKLIVSGLMDEIDALKLQIALLNDCLKAERGKKDWESYE